MDNYKDYLDRSDALTMQEASEIFDRMCSAVDQYDEDEEGIFQDFIEASVKYANVRAGWDLLANDEKAETDANRTACHNLVILQLNMTARILGLHGKDASWRDELGDESENRKRIGDFACYVACIRGLLAR